MDFLKEMELTTKMIKQFATTHKCDEASAAKVFALTAVRLIAEESALLDDYLSQIVRAIEDIR